MFRFIHISDLHIEEPVRLETVLGQLVEDLQTEQGVDRLDAIVLSGDSAEKARTEQFRLAKELLQGLAEAVEVPPGQILLVPGNHDVDWNVSEEAYSPIRRENFTEVTPVAHWQESDASSYVEVVEDPSLYKRRFDGYAGFHREVTGREFAADYADQRSVVSNEDRSIVLLGLNSAWNLDHRHPDRSGINESALNRALKTIRSEYADATKIAIWHHPVDGQDAPLGDTSFLQRLVVQGFAAVFHGHVHKPVQAVFPYEHDGRQLPILGAGTVDAEPHRGHPWQYNLITVDEQKIVVDSRAKSERNGAWGPGATFRVRQGLAPQQQLTISLPAGDGAGLLGEAPEETAATPRLPPLKTLDELTEHLATDGFEAAGYRIAVEALIFDANGRMLLQVRGPDCRDEVGRLEGVGGQLDKEDLVTCLIEHIAGEIGDSVRVEVEELLEVRPVQFLERSQPEDWIVVSYLCRLFEGEPEAVDTGKTADLRWLTVSELHNLPDYELSRSTSRARDLYWLKYRSRPYFSASESEG